MRVGQETKVLNQLIKEPQLYPDSCLLTNSHFPAVYLTYRKSRIEHHRLDRLIFINTKKQFNRVLHSTCMKFLLTPGAKGFSLVFTLDLLCTMTSQVNFVSNVGSFGPFNFDQSNKTKAFYGSKLFAICFNIYWWHDRFKSKPIEHCFEC